VAFFPSCEWVSVAAEVDTTDSAKANGIASRSPWPGAFAPLPAFRLDQGNLVDIKGARSPTPGRPRGALRRFFNRPAELDASGMGFRAPAARLGLLIPEHPA